MKMEQNQNINISGDELLIPAENKVDNTVNTRIFRDNKFDSKGNSLIYEEKSLDVIKNFVKSYRYLYNLFNNLDENNDKYLDIKNNINKNKKLYKECLSLINQYNSIRCIGKSRLLNKMTNFVEKNISSISLLFDFVHPLGKVLKLQDPDEVIGYY